MGVDHRDYRNFIHLATTLHYGRTARALGMSTSAVTRAVQKLEEEVGHPLLVRDRREVTLTAAGHRFRAFAQAQLSEWERFQQELDSEDLSPRGDLRIACTVTACYSVLPGLLAKCRERFPNIALQLSTQDASRSLQQLDAGEVDVAVVPTEEPPPGLLMIPLAQTNLVFIAPAERPPGNDWTNLPVILPSHGIERTRLDRWLRTREPVPPIGAEIRGNEAIIAMVGLGCGFGLVPELVLASSPMKHRVRRLDEPAPPGYTVSLCTTPRGARRRVVEAFWRLASGETVGPAVVPERSRNEA